MLLSLQSDYALRVLLDVASNRGNGVVTRQIAERQRVPRVFLTKIVAQLANHGFLRTQRGKGGGIMLAREPSQINILNVIEVFEGRLRANPCTASDDFCEFTNDCSVRHLWFDIEKKLRDHLRGLTLAELKDLGQKTYDDSQEGVPSPINTNP